MLTQVLILLVLTWPVVCDCDISCQTHLLFEQTRQSLMTDTGTQDVITRKL